MSDIVKEDWFPSHEPLEYPEEFVNWIDSINTDFRQMGKYKPFEVYKKQAREWLSDKDVIEDYNTHEEQVYFVIREYKRCKDNTLYAANKYGKLKEGSADIDGGVSYEAWKAQEIILFLVDCGYSCFFGKPRQVGFTSTMGLLADFKINCNKSYFVKFITHSREKGEEIFQDKIRWSFGMLPDWLRQEVYNDAHNVLGLKGKKKKGKTSGANSRIQVATPQVEAINGGSPNLVMIDEMGAIDFFSEMMNEGRPTLFFYNPKRKRMEIRRQLIAWGTSVYDKDAKHVAVFEKEFKAAMNAWRERSFKYGIIPLFFNAFAREGLTKKLFDDEKKAYYSKGTKASKIQFHQHYPMTIDDMFIRDDATIAPINLLNERILKINRLEADGKIQYGYFEPVFNLMHATPEDDVPYKIKGAKFIPTSGFSDDRTTTVIYQHPERGWSYRYYQGTDPINSETGSSKMSSAIWDAQNNTVSAVVNWRVKTFKECYLQCLLLGLYYEPVWGCKELLESNIGDMYLDYISSKDIKFEKKFIPNKALPKFMQTPTSKWWGISNKTNTAGRIANKIIELVDVYLDNINILWFMLQLKTFVEKPLKSSTSYRQSRYQANDLRYDRDDVIFSIAFAYLAAECYIRYEPKAEKPIEEPTGERVVTRQDASTNWQLKRVLINEKGRILRYL